MYHRQKSTVCGRFYNYFKNVSKWAYTCGKRTGGYIKRLPFEGSSRRQAGEGWLL